MRSASTRSARSARAAISSARRTRRTRYKTAFYAPIISDWRNFETWARGRLADARSSAPTGSGRSGSPTYEEPLHGPGDPRGAQRLRREAQGRRRRADGFLSRRMAHVRSTPTPSVFELKHWLATSPPVDGGEEGRELARAGALANTPLAEGGEVCPKGRSGGPPPTADRSGESRRKPGTTPAPAISGRAIIRRKPCCGWN